MIIDCISDLHGYYPELEGGDLLIVGGDLTASDTEIQYFKLFQYLRSLNYTKIVVIGGNHDNSLLDGYTIGFALDSCEYIDYLCDSGTEFEGLKIWGSPWTKTFPGMNPHCKAFTVDTEEELAEKWALIPDDVDILITHGPPYGVLDGIPNEDGSLFHVGSKSLRRQMERINPKLWVCGHIHEGYGEFKDVTLSNKYFHFVNASHVNEHYEPVNKPVRVIL